jgi:hypothetical protein
MGFYNELARILAKIKYKFPSIRVNSMHVLI